MLLPLANGCVSTVSAGETGDACVGAQTTSSGVTGADASSAAKRNSSGWVDCFECGLGWCRGLLALFFQRDNAFGNLLSEMCHRA